ncbi:ROK family protein, partial [Streptomyces sp. NPDC006265]|uniref:ROK family protein n=1 Tax=Streptomyces sp. NPDC006265 TaxID=3156740 RepID=UPI0033B41CC9
GSEDPSGKPLAGQDIQPAPRDRITDGGTLRWADAADCAKAVDSGDPKAGAVWQQAIEALADGLVMALTLLDPRILIIGGGLAEAGETLFTPLREAIRARITFQKQPSIVPAALGDAAGCLGAGLLAWDLLTSTDRSEVST